ncbi:hypothetical protein BC629DRAFT_1611213 [Irpex lacteus]|nr:hypothetical protein BC629DRAFT_1611213 [Irpex lacteus]
MVPTYISTDKGIPTNRDEKTYEVIYKKMTRQIDETGPEVPAVNVKDRDWRRISASIARRRGRRDVGDRQGDDKAWVVIWECLKMRMAHIKIFAGGSDQKGQPPGRARSEKSSCRESDAIEAAELHVYTPRFLREDYGQLWPESWHLIFQNRVFWEAPILGIFKLSDSSTSVLSLPSSLDGPTQDRHL